MVNNPTWVWLYIDNKRIQYAGLHVIQRSVDRLCARHDGVEYIESDADITKDYLSPEEEHWLEVMGARILKIKHDPERSGHVCLQFETAEQATAFTLTWTHT